MRSKTTGYKKMTRQYTIADHLIEVTAPEDAALWEVCTNYTPFDLKPGNGAEQKGMTAPSPLCSLQIVDELEVPETEPFYEVKQEGYPRLSFSRLDGGWAVRMAPDVNRPVLGVLMAAEDFRSARLKLLSGSARAIHFAVDNALMLMFALASAPFDTLEIHSSVTVCDGAGYAFLGKSGTIRSNLLLADRSATEESMRGALHIAAADFVFDLPLGLDSICGESGSGLSEGQCQRIAVARALLQQGSILLLDEATSSLDPATERLMLDNLREYMKRQGLTIISISHREAVTAGADMTISL